MMRTELGVSLPDRWTDMSAASALCALCGITQFIELCGCAKCAMARD